MTRASGSERSEFAFTITLGSDQLDALAEQVAEIILERRDDGFLDVAAAARYLSTTPKSIYHLVERKRLPHRRAGGRLLFDPAELRSWVQRG